MTRRTFMNKHLKPVDNTAMSLLEKAKALNVIRKTGGKGFSEQEIELVEAWLKDEVAIGKVQIVMGFKNSVQTYVFLARAVKFMYQRTNND